MAIRLVCVLGLVTALACDVDDYSNVREGDACRDHEDVIPCTKEGEEEESEGLRFCDEPSPSSESSKSLEWGRCVTQSVCELGESESCSLPEGGSGTMNCILHHGEPTWDSNVYFDAGCNTPLVLSFDGAPIHMEAAPASAFDIDDVGACVTTDWPTNVTPWLALDIDRDGIVETGAEMFGSGTRLADGRRAHDGFEALAALDSNGDGRISAADERFADLVLWSDADRDKRGTSMEFESLGARGILSIELDYQIDRRCDGRGNCEVERARFRFIDAMGDVRNGEIVDIHLACQ